MTQSGTFNRDPVRSARRLNRFDAFASVLVSKGDPSRVTIPELFDEVEEKLAAIPPNGATSS